MVYLDLLKPLGIDFPIYYEAALMWLAGLNPYQNLLTSPGPFNYPPTSIWVIGWLGIFKLQTAGILWNFVSLGCFIGSIRMLINIYHPAKDMKWLLIVMIGLFTIPFFPEKFNLGNGQINNLMLGLCVGFFYLYRKEKYWMSAICLALAIGTKLTPLIYLLPLLIKNDYRQVKRVLAALTGLLLLSVGLLSWDKTNIYFLDIFGRAFGNQGKEVYYNQSLSGFMARSFPDYWLTPLFLIGSLILVTTTIKAIKKSSLERGMAQATLLYLMIHPLTWQHHLVYTVWPLIAGLNWLHPVTWTIFWGLIAINIKDPNSVPVWGRIILSHQFLGVFGLWLKLIKAGQPNKERDQPDKEI